MSCDIYPIKRALLSLSDKREALSLVKELAKYNIEIIASKGTQDFLAKHQLKSRSIDSVTNFPEILGGRVKSLHPHIHGAILAKRDEPSHQSDLKNHNIWPIDLIITNLYPFAEIVKKQQNKDHKDKTANSAQIIENIDIGGSALMRASAKNYHFTTIITSIEDYQPLIGELAQYNGATSLYFRQKMAAKAFHYSAAYDRQIADYFAQQIAPISAKGETAAGENANSASDKAENAKSESDKGESAKSAGENPAAQIFPEIFHIQAQRKLILRYGENPHQMAALYGQSDSAQQTGIVKAQQIQGKSLSFNNIQDSDAAFDLISEFCPEQAAASAIIKHNNPCGLALAPSLPEAYSKALACDPLSAFGGIVAVNREIDEQTAQEISKIFTEVIIAPAISAKAAEILSKKPNLRILITALKGAGPKNELMIRSINGGFLMQMAGNNQKTAADYQIVTQKQPSSCELSELYFAFKAVKHVKSNAIVIAQNQQTIGIGAGQTSRVDAVAIACQKAQNFTKSHVNGHAPSVDRPKVLASDAFFPFADSITIAAQNGITAIIQPGGSIKDEEIIKAANEHNIAMIFTHERHFKH